MVPKALVAMIRVATLLIVLFCCIVHGASQSAPLIDVRKAVAEFISDDEIPQFTIKGIFLTGHVDTMKAVIKTSTVRALGSDYARYKPVLDNVSWIQIDSVRSEALVVLHLDGKGIPLPPDSVRGSVRMTVSAAAWNGTDWLGTTSEAFTVPVANVGVPRPLIMSNTMKVIRTGVPGGAQFTIAGVRLKLSTPDSVDRMVDVRVIDFADAAVQYEKKSLRTIDRENDGKRNVTLTSTQNTDGSILVSGSVDGPAIPAGEPFSFAIMVKARNRHGHILSPYRVKTISITVPK
ncbi:MAG: hypothetical protein NTX15_01095 [Candidatus Kapabacteria bacterium]|nr:hypothetical protein [Candidatus Kapabacteria bacterium]